MHDGQSKCEHGAEQNWWWKAMSGCAWAGGIYHCACCDSNFGYIASASFRGDGSGHERTWRPVDRCSKCGGEYVERDWPARAER